MELYLRAKYGLNFPGKCIIFNHKTYKNQPNKLREGTDKDIQIIRETFGDIGFDIKLHNDLEVEKLQEELLNSMISL